MAPSSPTTDLSLFNSTSRLLSFLDLNDQQNMENMDIDLISVPDTPDRLSSQRINRGLDVVEEIGSPSVASSSGVSNLLDKGVRNRVRENGKLNIENLNNSRRLFSHPRGRGDIGIHGETRGNSNDVINVVESPSVSRNVRPYRRNITNRVLSQPQFTENGSSGDDRAKLDGGASSIAEILADDNKMRGKNKDRRSDLICSSKTPSSNLSPDDKNPRKKTLLNGNMCSEMSDGLYNSAATHVDRGKGIHLPSDSRQSRELIMSRLQLPKKSGHNRLVRNGCISPCNIEKTKNTAESHEKNSENGPQDGFSPPRSLINIVSPSSGENPMDRVKGKGIMEECSSQKFDNPTLHSSNSSSCNPADEPNIIGDSSGDLIKTIEVKDGWRSTRNRSSNTLSDGVTRRSSTNIGLRHPHEVNASSETDREKVRPCGTSEIAGRQRKRCSTSNSHGECSMSVSDSEIAFLGSSVEPANARSTRSRSNRHHGNLHQIIEIDDIIPDLRSRSFQSTSQMVNRSPQITRQRVNRSPQNTSQMVSDESDDRARQLQADEILARELQEQFYHELPEVGGGEVDANIAWTLQHEEEAQRASFRRQHVHSRDASMAHLYRQHQTQQALQSIRSRARARAPTSARVGRLRERFHGNAPTTRSSRERDIRFHPNMDVEMRMHILEALEAAVGTTDNAMMPNSLLQLNRDFNENDYEMLLALDENNHQHVGANSGQINGLPQSVVQSENFSEACAVCLETPTVGDTIRHLPCLHKFHKDCIDPWLRRKTSCPICKSGIT